MLVGDIHFCTLNKEEKTRKGKGSCARRQPSNSKTPTWDPNIKVEQEVRFKLQLLQSQ